MTTPQKPSAEELTKFLVTISGKDGEHDLKWSQEIDRKQALNLIARVEGFYLQKKPKS